jgi:hypothetical protein
MKGVAVALSKALDTLQKESVPDMPKLIVLAQRLRASEDEQLLVKAHNAIQDNH